MLKLNIDVKYLLNWWKIYRRECIPTKWSNEDQL